MHYDIHLYVEMCSYQVYQRIEAVLCSVSSLTPLSHIMNVYLVFTQYSVFKNYSNFNAHTGKEADKSFTQNDSRNYRKV